MRLSEFTVKSNLKDYMVSFEKDFDFVKDLSVINNAVFVVDENVWAAYKDSCLKCLPSDKVIVLNIGEQYKNINSVCDLYEKIMQFAPRKNMTLVSIGGGITQDITGFVASSLYRGINWIFVPTTLLAQVDSCIGAKTSLNFNSYKNLIGTFYPPAQIFICSQFLNTLTNADYYSGVGEMAKLHLMSGQNDTNAFINDLNGIDARDADVLLVRTKKCLEIKKSYIENDEFDTGRRNMLNYGHCFGHAIESSSDFAISHGQAVVVGMILANIVAVRRGVLNSETEQFIRKTMFEPILKVEIPEIDIAKTVAAMRQDKKNTGNGLALIMLTDGYQMVKITDMQDDEAMSVLETLK